MRIGDVTRLAIGRYVVPMRPVVQLFAVSRRQSIIDEKRQRHGRPFEPLSRSLRALAARSAGLLGARRRPDIDWFEKPQDRVRSEGRHLWPLVRRRRLQHLLQRGRPPCRCRARRAGGDHLRFAARRHEAHHHLSPPADRDAGARRHAARSRRRQRRPRHPLHADGAGGGDRHARLRAHRRGPFGGVRRLRRARACDPHRRCQAEGHPVGKLRHRARPHRRLQAAARRGDRAGAAQARRLPRSCSGRRRKRR